MSDTESDFLDIDPSKLTVPQLKQTLLKLGVDLPMKTEKKQYYVDLLTSKQEEKRKEIEKSKRKREAAEEAEKEKATPKKAKKTDEDDEESSSAKKNRKRRQSNPFQADQDQEDEEKLETKPRRRSISRTTEPVKTETTVAVVEEVKEVATPSRRSTAIVEATTTTTTTTTAAAAPPSPSRQRRYRTTETAAPSTTAVSGTPTRRTRLTGTLSQGGTETAPVTSSVSATTTTPRRSTASSVTTPYTDWRANRERRRSQSGIDTASILGNVPITSAEDADRFLSKEVTPEKPSISRIPGPSTLETAPVKQFDLISYLYTGLIFAWIAFVVALIFFGALGGKFPFGSVTFCDTEYTPDANDTCVVCPPHGLCSNGILVCNAGYVRSGTLCVEDIEFNLQAAKMTEAVKDYLARKRGSYDCNSEETFEEIESNLIALLKATGIAEPEDFDNIFEKAKLGFEDYGIYHNAGVDSTYYVHPEDGIKPLACRFHIFLIDHIFQLFGLVTATALIWFIINKFKTKEEEKALARSFVEKTYEMLQQQKIQMQLAATNGLDLAPYIAVEHIRDALLVPPVDRSKRNRIWGMTSAVINSDARVQETTVMLHGNQETVWEWVAPVRLPKEVLTPGRSNKQDE